MRIGQDFFSGERPRIADHLMKGHEAQLVKNCDLSSGELRPFRAHTKTNITETGLIKSLYHWKTNGGAFWIANTKELQFARSPVAGEAHSRVYVTGEGLSEPRVLTTSIQSYPFNIDTDYYKLGVPAPAAAPTIDAGYTTGASYRAYLYTYVVKLDDSYAEEGVNSAIASVTDYGSGNVTISGFTAPPANRSIGAIRVYRISSSTAGTAEFQYVDEFDTDGVDFTTKTFIDNVAEADLGETLSTSTFSPPPSTLKGIIALKNGSLAGFVGKRVYISEPYLPHAWPYSYPVDANIVGLGLIGATIIVLTDEHPYLMDGQPEAISTQKISSRKPCVSRRGIVSCDLGVLYPSDDGISLVTYDSVTTYSYEYFTRDQYNTKYAPSSIRAEYFDGKYFAYHDSGGFIIDVRDKTLAEITDPLQVSAIHYSTVDNELYFIAIGDNDTPNAIYKFQGNKDGTFLTYVYRGKRYAMPYDTNLAACKIIVGSDVDDNDDNITANTALFVSGVGGGDVNAFVVNDTGAVPNYDNIVKTYSATFRLYGDKDTLLLTKTITGTVVFRLPAAALYTRYYYELEGDLPISACLLSPSMAELSE